MCGTPRAKPGVRARQRRGIQAQALQAEPGGELGAPAAAGNPVRVLAAALQGQPPHPQRHAPGSALPAVPGMPLPSDLDHGWLPRLACPGFPLRRSSACQRHCHVLQLNSKAGQQRAGRRARPALAQGGARPPGVGRAVAPQEGFHCG